MALVVGSPAAPVEALPPGTDVVDLGPTAVLLLQWIGPAAAVVIVSLVGWVLLLLASFLGLKVSALHRAVIEAGLERAVERRAGVVIECLDWSAFIDRYDKPETLFYLDPPYFGSEHYYGRDLFGRDQFEVIAARLRTLKGRFILSINDRPEVRDVFSGFAVEPAELMYGVGGGGQTTAAKELIVSGPQLRFEAASSPS